MLEKDVIINKLKAEGVSDTLGANLAFETADELDAWVNSYKSTTPKEKKLQDYTLDELEEIAKDPQFKGAKGLQGFLDKERQKAREKSKTPNDPPKDDDKLDKLLEELNNLKSSIKEKEEANSQSATLALVKSEFTDADEIDIVMTMIGKDRSPGNVRGVMSKCYNKFNKTSSPLHSSGGGGSTESAVKKWKEGNKK